jgi:hypothetical protein
MFYRDWRQKLLYNTSPAKQLMAKFVRRYRAGRAVPYDEQISTEPIQGQGDQFVETEISEGQLPEQPEYEPIQFDPLPEFHTPDLAIEPPQAPQADVPLEGRLEDPREEIQDAIDEIREPDNLEDLLRINLFPPPF